jgi:hypothetical protein
MALYFNDYTHESSFGGDTFCGRYASGRVINVFPGLGLLVENDNYKYLIVNNFGNPGKMLFHYLETIPSDYTYKALSDETILFWLKGGVSTKACIYGSEIKRRMLIDPKSDVSLYLPLKVSPIISPDDYYPTMGDQYWNFLKQTGTLPIENGDDAPIPQELSLIRELHRQTNEWHLLRSRVLNDIQAMPYKYTFLQCGRKLLIEANGKKLSTVNYSDNTVHLYTPINSTMCSPANPFVIRSPTPHMEEFGDLSLEESKADNNQFTESVKRLSNEEIDEGIEEAYWEMRRLRKGSEEKTIIQIQKWVDAAYDEKQFRREN